MMTRKMRVDRGRALPVLQSTKATLLSKAPVANNHASVGCHCTDCTCDMMIIVLVVVLMMSTIMLEV